MNNVWVKMAEFLGRLNGESVSRESYVRTPEYEMSRPRQHGHLKRKDSIRFLVFLDFSLIFIRSG